MESTQATKVFCCSVHSISQAVGSTSLAIVMGGGEGESVAEEDVLMGNVHMMMYNT